MHWNPARILLAPLSIDLILSAFSRVSTSPVLNAKRDRDQENLLTFAIDQGASRLLADAISSVIRPCSGATGCSVLLTLTILTPSNNEFRCLFVAARNFPLPYQVLHFSVTI
jgi:hypothetical protein